MVFVNVQMEVMRLHVVNNIIMISSAFITSTISNFYAGSCGYDFGPALANGIITSPSYPDMYPKYEECVYRISQNSGSYISLQIHTFHLLMSPPTAKCHDSKIQDFIEIRDGNSSESVLIGKFCGTDIPNTIQSTHNSLWIK